MAEEDVRGVSDRDVRDAYTQLLHDVVDALNDHPSFSGAELIPNKGAIFVMADTPVGPASLYFPSIVSGGLMSDRARRAAEEHAAVLVERIREREVSGG